MLSYTQCTTIQRPSQSTLLIYFRVIKTALKANSIRNLQIVPFHAFFVTKVFKSDKLLKMGNIQKKFEKSPYFQRSPDSTPEL